MKWKNTINNSTKNSVNVKIIILVVIIIIIRLLITEGMIMITTEIVIKMIMIIMEKKDWERNFDLNKKLVRYICQNNIFYWKLQALLGKQIKTKTKIKTVGYLTPIIDQSQEWIDETYLSPLWYVMLTKVMDNT